MPRHGASFDLGLQETVEAPMLSDSSQFLHLRYILETCRPRCGSICVEIAYFYPYNLRETDKSRYDLATPF